MLLLLLQLQPKTKSGLQVLVALDRCANRNFNARVRVPLIPKHAPGKLQGEGS